MEPHACVRRQSPEERVHPQAQQNGEPDDQEKIDRKRQQHNLSRRACTRSITRRRSGQKDTGSRHAGAKCKKRGEEDLDPTSPNW